MLQEKDIMYKLQSDTQDLTENYVQNLQKLSYHLSEKMNDSDS